MPPSESRNGYFDTIRAALNAGADSAVVTFDYVTAPLDSLPPPPVGQPLSGVPAVRVAPPALPQNVIVEGSILDTALEQLCTSTIGGDALVVTQAQMDAAPPNAACLVPSQRQPQVSNSFPKSYTPLVPPLQLLGASRLGCAR